LPHVAIATKATVCQLQRAGLLHAVERCL